MAPSVHMVLLLTFLLNLSETPVSAPAHRSSTSPQKLTKAGRGSLLVRS
ncbi:galanin-like peptide [Castor canadensis]|uniref:Galanin-like peptide n=1 Tax=Castor canadensis TaxID=51338 RepID=A0AC58LBS4_CASCN